MGSSTSTGSWLAGGVLRSSIHQVSGVSMLRSTSLTFRFVVERNRTSSFPLVGFGPRYRPSRSTNLLRPLPFQWNTTLASEAIRRPFTDTISLPSRFLFEFCCTITRT